MYIRVYVVTLGKITVGAQGRAFPGPRFTMADKVLVQNVNSIKMASVTPHLKDNLMQNHIFIRKIPQMGNFPNYDLKMIK